MSKSKSFESRTPQSATAIMAVTSEPFWKKPGFKRKGNDMKGGSSKKKQCGKCGRNNHPEGKACPAIGRDCKKCGEKGHFAAVCTRVQKAKKEMGESGKEVD